MNKILIIGQAPPAKPQDIPYDSTSLFDWLNEIGISKERALEIFEFEAVYDKFPGFDSKGNHKTPTYEQFEDYLQRGLKEKILKSSKIILVGKIAMKFVLGKEIDWCKTIKSSKTNIHYLCLPHPSKRNSLLHKQIYESLINSLRDFVNL